MPETVWRRSYVRVPPVLHKSEAIGSGQPTTRNLLSYMEKCCTTEISEQIDLTVVNREKYIFSLLINREIIEILFPSTTKQKQQFPPDHKVLDNWSGKSHHYSNCLLLTTKFCQCFGSTTGKIDVSCDLFLIVAWTSYCLNVFIVGNVNFFLLY